MHSREDYLAQLAEMLLQQKEGQRPTLEEAMEQQGIGVLPKPSGADLTPLIQYLDTECFTKKRLVKKTALVEDHDRFHPMQCLIRHSDMSAIGLKPESYATRDWTLAVEKMLTQRGCPPNMVKFGTAYRVLFNSEGVETLSIMVSDSVFNRCRGSGPEHSPAA